MVQINQTAFLQNQMRRTNNQMQKSMRHLSSGKRITQAADDAAGLVISQKMRAQIRGLSQASRNVMDAGSLLQVAEGGMKEINDLLLRIRELSVQAATDTLQESDRLVIQEEIDQLKQTMSEIVHHTEFNHHKVLSNTNSDIFIEETRTQQKVIGMRTTVQPQLPIYTHHMVDTTRLDAPEIDPFEFDPVHSRRVPSTDFSTNVKGTTVLDHQPRYSADGQSIIFQSSREAGTYVVPADLSASSEVYDGSLPTSAQTTSSDQLAKLETFGTNLRLYTRSSSSGTWYHRQTFSDYNYRQDGSNGFSFAPTTVDGETSFVYSDTDGNIQQVQIHTRTGTVLEKENIISSSDELHIPPTNNTIQLSSTPKLYRMGEENASLKVYKATDSGENEVLYWNGEGDPPEDAYFTLSGSQVTFHGDAIIGHEPGDDAQDYYRFSYVSSSGASDIYTKYVPSGADIYHMDGSDGPRSLDILVGGNQVGKEDLLASQPIDPEVDGVYYNSTTNQLEFYGDWRPAHNQNVRVNYITNQTPDGVYTQFVSSGIDLYNLEDPELEANRSLRVFVAGEELQYNETNGFTYNRETGYVSIHGDARPDLPANEAVRIEFFADPSGSATSEYVVGLPLGEYHPELYNLATNESPSSIKVFRNGTEAIEHSDVNGFQYNEETNTIELYGDARPDASDSYTVKVAKDSRPIVNQDGVVEVSLIGNPEVYSHDGSTDPVTIEVLVNGEAISYDESRTNGYIYNQENNTIEIYGNARPSGGENVSVNYLIESSTFTYGNNTYDLTISPSPLHYGVSDGSEPRAMRVYYKNEEVPYGEANGFTFDPEQNLVSLHGSYRPIGEDSIGDLEVVSITADHLKQPIPTGHRVYQVSLNGELVEPAEENDGHGFVINGQTVELVGDARPNVERNQEIRLEVLHFEPTTFPLDVSGLVYDPFDDEWISSQMVSTEIIAGTLSVKLNGANLDEENYTLMDNVLHFSEDLNLSRGNNTLEATFDLNHPTGFESNQFTFQVGAQAGQHYQVEIQSFNNMLLRAGGLSVVTRDRADQTIGLVDDLTRFVTTERSRVGASQNRLDVIASNLGSAEENATASLSRIEDADMAKAIMQRVKTSIIQQAQQAMQAHEMESNQAILALLQ